MKPTASKPNGASPLFTDAEWHALAAVEKARWTAFRRDHPSSEWRPLCRAIIELGYRTPPSEQEAEYLWPLVDARPNDAADWLREAGKPQGSLRFQPSWPIALRAITVHWFELRDEVLSDDEDDDWREGRADAIATLQRIGWYRSG